MRPRNGTTFEKVFIQELEKLMTPTEYKTRIKALGFTSGASWARFVGIDRTTHFRHLKGSRGIPATLIKIVEWMEAGELDNPNVVE